MNNKLISILMLFTQLLYCMDNFSKPIDNENSIRIEFQGNSAEKTNAANEIQKELGTNEIEKISAENKIEKELGTNEIEPTIATNETEKNSYSGLLNIFNMQKNAAKMILEYLTIEVIVKLHMANKPISENKFDTFGYIKKRIEFAVKLRELFLSDFDGFKEALKNHDGSESLSYVEFDIPFELLKCVQLGMGDGLSMDITESDDNDADRKYDLTIYHYIANVISNEKYEKNRTYFEKNLYHPVTKRLMNPWQNKETATEELTYFLPYPVGEYKSLNLKIKSDGGKNEVKLFGHTFPLTRHCIRLRRFEKESHPKMGLIASSNKEDFYYSSKTIVNKLEKRGVGLKFVFDKNDFYHEDRYEDLWWDENFSPPGFEDEIDVEYWRYDPPGFEDEDKFNRRNRPDPEYFDNTPIINYLSNFDIINQQMAQQTQQPKQQTHDSQQQPNQQNHHNQQNQQNYNQQDQHYNWKL